jgi:hypothetical protein
MSDTLTADEPLLRLLAHGWGELVEDAEGATLTLTVAAEERTLAQLVELVDRLARPGDARRYIVRNHRIVAVHLIRRQDQAPA